MALLLGYGSAAALSLWLQGKTGFAMQARLGVEEFILTGPSSLSYRRGRCFGGRSSRG